MIISISIPSYMQGTKPKDNEVMKVKCNDVTAIAKIIYCTDEFIAYEIQDDFQNAYVLDLINKEKGRKVVIEMWIEEK